jgi:hypothetical protein
MAEPPDNVRMGRFLWRAENHGPNYHGPVTFLMLGRLGALLVYPRNYRDRLRVIRDIDHSMGRIPRV